MEYYIIRTKSAGVFFAKIVRLKKQTADLTDSRRLWYWEGACSLSELAINGTANPEACKFPVALETHKVFEVIETIKCTEKAIKSIKGVKVWCSSDD